MAPAPRWVAASQCYQLLFDVSLDLDVVRPWGLGLVVDGCLEALCDEPLPYAFDRPQTRCQRQNDFFIRATFAVCLQEDSSMGQLSSCCLSRGNQTFQFSPFLRRKVDPILVHRGPPFP